jgi:hypothetical protein
MQKTVVELDVREDIAKSEDPFQKIMKTVTSMQTGDVLILHAPFQPVPLYGVLTAKGFKYDTVQLDEKHFKTLFTKNN